MRFPGNDPGIRFGIAPRTAAPLQAPALVTLRCHYMAKKYKNHGKKVARSFVFPFFQCRNIFFSGARGGKSRCGARLPMPAGDAQMHPVSATICGHSGLSRGKHGKPACAAAESREMLPVGRKKGQSRLRRRRERGNAACRRERESRAGRREQKRFLQNPYNFLTIN